MAQQTPSRRKVVITGASSGIGRATTVRFAADGYDVCAIDIQESLLSGLLASIPTGDHLDCPGDYHDPSVVVAIEATLRDRWGRVDVLVNCAGVFHAAHVVDSPYEHWRATFDIMVNGALRMTRAVVPLMLSGGRIVHITSIHGERAEAGAGAYGMAKAAINQFCRALALELAPQNILVNAIAPGFVRTNMSIRPDGVSELDTEWFQAQYVRGHHLPLRRAAQPEEIAGVAAFLAGPDSTYVTGQVIAVDGGLTITF